MPKYNLYRIPQDKEDALLKKLRLSGLEQIGEQEIEGFHMRFFFSKEPDKIEIWWVETYKKFLGNLEAPKNLMHFGVLLISGEKICYAVSLGKAHFYLSQLCDADFGLNLAERIINENSLKIKNSKYYKSSRSKMITTYQQGSQIAFDSGESMHYIKGRTIDSDMWGSTVSFGNSVYLNIAREPDQLPDLINHIENILKQPARVKIPKVDIVKDKDTIQNLDKVLVKAILRTGEASGINIEEFTMSGVDFIFVDSHEYSLYLKGKSDEAVRLTELSVESLAKFIKSSNINLEEKINDLKVKVHNEYGRDHTKPLKFYLDFIKEDDLYCLIDGIWHRFNQSYVDFLKEEVDKIKLNYDSSFDISSEVEESEFNKDRERDGYLNYDTVIKPIGRYRVENMDLYKDKTLFFVKKGTPQKLSYVIDQAINTVKSIQNNANKIEINGKIIDAEGICLWMILARQTKIASLSEINSIIFHMKLVEWKRILIDAGLKPLVNINYLID